MKHIVTATAIKGGTGKTATAGSIAQAAAEAGLNVLAVDLDPQASLSIWLDADLRKPGSYALLSKRVEPAEAVQPTRSNISLIAAGADLTGIKTAPGSARRLEDALNVLKGQYDFIVIDTAPAMGELQNNSLFAATDVLIPLETEASSLQALYQVADIVDHVRESKPTLNVAGVIITKYDSRPNINRYLRDTIKEKCSELNIPYLMEIRNGIAIREAMAMQQPLFEYAPRSKPAEDYKTLYERIMKAT